MTQNFFSTLTNPSLPLLDANFTELYSGVTVSDSTVAQNLKATTARLRFWPYYSPLSAAMIDVVNPAESTNKDLVIYASAILFEGGNLLPFTDNARNVGSASKRPAQYFGASGTINTSDAREKTAVLPLSAAEIAAAQDLAKEIGTYRWLVAVETKGEAARRHIGMTVQRAIEIFEAHGLDSMAYGCICYDQWPAQTVPAKTKQRDTGLKNNDGTPLYETIEIEPERTIPGGDRYSFRTDELLLFIARGFEARLSALEAAIAP